MDRGFCPGPADYRFNGNAFVFSLQATALNPPLGAWRNACWAPGRLSRTTRCPTA